MSIIYQKINVKSGSSRTGGSSTYVRIITFFLAEIASLQAELYMSMVCFNSSRNLFISASISFCNEVMSR